MERKDKKLEERINKTDNIKTKEKEEWRKYIYGFGGFLSCTAIGAGIGYLIGGDRTSLVAGSFLGSVVGCFVANYFIPF